MQPLYSFRSLAILHSSKKNISEDLNLYKFHDYSIVRFIGKTGSRKMQLQSKTPLDVE